MLGDPQLLLELLGAGHFGNTSVGQTCSPSAQLRRGKPQCCSRADGMIRCESGWVLGAVCL